MIKAPATITASAPHVHSASIKVAALDLFVNARATSSTRVYEKEACVKINTDATIDFRGTSFAAIREKIYIYVICAYICFGVDFSQRRITLHN